MILSRCHSNYKHANPSGGRFNVVACRVLQQCKTKREILVNSCTRERASVHRRVSAAAFGLKLSIVP
jgi:hypothetical protein